MFNNNQTNNQLNTNSTILSWYSKTTKLVIGAWNDKISLKFYESTGEDSNGLTTYSDKPISTALTQENASVLYEAIEKEIIPHIVDKDDVEVNVIVSIGIGENQNALMIERKKDDNNNLSIYLTFLKGLGADGKVNSQTQVLSYKFNDMEYMKDYDCNTGDGVTYTLSGQFMVFCSILKERTLLLQISTHAQKHLQNMRSRFGGNSGPNKPSAPANGSFTDAFSALEEELPFS